MGHIQIPADNHGLFLIQPFQVLPEGIVPFEPMVNPGQLPLGIGSIAGHQEEVGIFQGDQSSFIVQLRVSQTEGAGKRRFSGKDGCSGVALLLRVVPILGVARQRKRNLIRLKLGFLQTEKIRLRGVKKFLKAFAKAGPQAVNIPGNIVHVVSSVVSGSPVISSDKTRLS